jgi:hypothetical protein
MTPSKGEAVMNSGIPSRFDSNSKLQRERMLSFAAAGLGVLMFVWGFLRWFELGDEPDELKYSGFAFQTPSTAVIGFALAAGLMAFLGATESRPGRGVPSAIPTALAATGFLLAVGLYAGKDEISPDDAVKVAADIGLILALITSLLQTLVLGLGLASRHDDGRDDDVGRIS